MKNYNEINFIGGIRSKKVKAQSIKDIDLLHERGKSKQKMRIKVVHNLRILYEGNDLTRVLQEITK